MSRPRAEGAFWNVNLPHLDPGAARPEVVFCPLDPSPLPPSFLDECDDVVRYDGVYHHRVHREGTDVDVWYASSGKWGSA